MADEPQKLGRGISIKGHTVLTGSCSWTDRTLVQDADWYPRKTMSAEERLRYYAAQFPLTEIDSTYYAPPAEQQARLWAERTPDGFRFDVKAYSLLTGHPTRPQSLWRDLRDALPPMSRRSATSTPTTSTPRRSRRRGGASPTRCGRCTRRASSARSCSSTRHGSDRGARTAPRCETLRERLPDYRVAVEFRSPRWLAEERDRERTLGMLEEHGLVFVCVDAPASLRAAADHGRDQSGAAGASASTAAPTAPGRTRRGSAAERFRYLYSEQELEELAHQVREVARAGDARRTCS